MTDVWQCVCVCVCLCVCAVKPGDGRDMNRKLNISSILTTNGDISKTAEQSEF